MRMFQNFLFFLLGELGRVNLICRTKNFASWSDLVFEEGSWLGKVVNRGDHSEIKFQCGWDAVILKNCVLVLNLYCDFVVVIIIYINRNETSSIRIF